MGATAFMPKRKRSTQPREKIELRAPADWVAKVEEAVAALGRSISAYVRLAVSERMEAEQIRMRRGGHGDRSRKK
jgi:hypothetical protein